MPQLILTRHAEAEPHHPNGDFHRPLSEFGQTTAHRLGQDLQGKAIAPDQVIVSSASRTIQTAQAMGFDDIETTRNLYNANAQTILETLRSAHGDTVLLVAHNPGIAQAGLTFWGGAPEPEHLMYFPPATTMIFDISTAWCDLDWDKATPILAIDPLGLNNPA